MPFQRRHVTSPVAVAAVDKSSSDGSQLLRCGMLFFAAVFGCCLERWIVNRERSPS